MFALIILTRDFEGERSEYKFDCDCRKPKAGMLIVAAKDWNIDLSLSYMIGDSFRDIEAGENTKLKKSILIPTNKDGALFNIISEII